MPLRQSGSAGQCTLVQVSMVCGGSIVDEYWDPVGCPLKL